jgi:thiamine-phosphate pyrophosphorylase
VPVSRFPARGLYAITADTGQAPETLWAQAEIVLANGASVLQFRNKSADRDAKMRIARRLRALCTTHHVCFIVNDDIELALAIDADGVHLGRDDPDFRPLAAEPGHRLVVGVSCYDSLTRAREAAAAGADYVAFGSFYPSSTKTTAVRCPLDLLTQARSELDLPLVAIGGITPENGATLLRAGADFLAVISGIFGQPDVAAATRSYQRLFSS